MNVPLPCSFGIRNVASSNLDEKHDRKKIGVMKRDWKRSNDG